MSTVPQPYWQLTYLSKDVTADITPYVVSVVYADVEHGESDSIEVHFEDSDDLWKNDWYPTKGDQIDLDIGYRGQPLLPCGQFQVDDIVLQGPPDIVIVSGLSAKITEALREENTVGYENQTLRDIANAVAARHGFTVQGTIRPIRLRRITQKQERDLGFLRRLGEEYGYVVAIRDDAITFQDWDTLNSVPPVLTLDKTDLTRFDLRDKTNHVYTACEVRYHDPITRQLMKFEVKNEDIETSASHAAGEAVPVEDPKPADVLKIVARCENDEQAEARALAALKRKNGMQTTGRLTLPGNVLCVSGNAVAVTGLGKLDGTFQVMSSRHAIDRDTGYVTEMEVRRRV
jgi:phage protein D